MMQDLYLKKSLGQHHLREGALCKPVIDYLRPSGRRVLEIGPGGGVLTAELAAAGGRVIGCEVDLAWAFELRRRLARRGGEARMGEARSFAGGTPRIAAIDTLRLDWRRLRSPTLVAGNLPFNVATRLIERLLPHADRVPRAAFMVQKEVAERLVARPGEAAYGALSVLVAVRAEARMLAIVKAGSFQPPPKVAAAFVGLALRPPPVAAEPMADFARLVRAAFAARRKTLRNSLATGLGRQRSAELMGAVGWDPRCRAQELGLEDFVELFAALQRLVGPSSA